MNKSALLGLIFGGLMFASGSLFATEGDPETAKGAKDYGLKIEELRQEAELHPNMPELEPGNFAVGKQKAFMCKGCHNKVGYKTAYPKVYQVPRLGGQHEEYIVSALRQYRSGDRKFATMRAMASNLTDQDIADIAAYYSSEAH
ncbi:MAG: c-type cytochrome [Gallionella sp.]